MLMVTHLISVQMTSCISHFYKSIKTFSNRRRTKEKIDFEQKEKESQKCQSIVGNILPLQLDENLFSSL